MAFTQGDLDAVRAAIASGATRVKYKDREVQYQTLDDLIKIKGLIERELGASSRSYRYPAYSKGV